jgi:hypothetical protein
VKKPGSPVSFRVNRFAEATQMMKKVLAIAEHFSISTQTFTGEISEHV